LNTPQLGRYEKPLRKLPIPHALERRSSTKEVISLEDEPSPQLRPKEFNSLHILRLERCNSDLART